MKVLQRNPEEILSETDLGDDILNRTLTILEVLERTTDGIPTKLKVLHDKGNNR